MASPPSARAAPGLRILSGWSPGGPLGDLVRHSCASETPKWPVSAGHNRLVYAESAGIVPPWQIHEIPILERMGYA